MSLKDDCLFCKIIKKEIPSKLVYEDDEVYAFHDINPAAPTHILIIPKKHIETVLDIDASENWMEKLVHCANNIAIDLGIDKTGFRLVVNCNQNAGQEVFHLHLHLIGGARLGKMA